MIRGPRARAGVTRTEGRVFSVKLVRALILAASASALCLAPSPARAELGWPKLSLSGYLGTAGLDDTYGVDRPVPFGVRAGFTFSNVVGIEGSYGKVHGKRPDVVPRHNYPLDQWAMDLSLNLLPSRKVNPYLFAGWAQLNLDEPKGKQLHLNGSNFGAGAKIRLKQTSAARWDFRVELRHVAAKNDPPLDDSGDLKHNTFLTAGITMTLANPKRDSDGDGVLDRFDRCPNTVPGAAVDPFGCELDYDEDGVPDGLDRCPSTPRGAIVDADGCPSDSDGDGVMDGIDLCNETLPGVIVDAAGCAMDSDGDGVFDGIDRCPGTRPRILVDEYGCPLTPAVTAPPQSAVETEFLNTGNLVLDNVYFQSGSAVLKPGSHAALDEVGKILVKWPDLQIEISGHTDSSGSDAVNQRISQGRAQAVLDYLKGKFPGIGASRLKAVGYGETRPIASNATSEGRAQNRRVEFKILNPGVLKKN